MPTVPALVASIRQPCRLIVRVLRQTAGPDRIQSADAYNLSAFNSDMMRTTFRSRGRRIVLSSSPRLLHRLVVGSLACAAGVETANAGAPVPAFETLPRAGGGSLRPEATWRACLPGVCERGTNRRRTTTPHNHRARRLPNSRRIRIGSNWSHRRRALWRPCPGRFTGGQKVVAVPLGGQERPVIVGYLALHRHP